MANFLCFVFCLAFLNLTNAGVLPEAPSPSNGNNLNKAQSHSVRKLDKHRKFLVFESESPEIRVKLVPAEKKVGSADRKTSVDSRTVNIQGEDVHLTMHHRKMGKSIACGGVIIAGLATSFIVSVFCYIRATRKQKLDPPSLAPEI